MCVCVCDISVLHPSKVNVALPIAFQPFASTILLQRQRSIHPACGTMAKAKCFVMRLNRIESYRIASNRLLSGRAKVMCDHLSIEGCASSF